MKTISDYLPPTPSLELLRRLYDTYIRSHVWNLVAAMVFMSLAAAATAANAWMMQPVLDDVFLKKDSQMLVLIPLVVLGIAVVRGLSEYAQAVLMSRTGQRIIADLQKDMFAHLMRADIAFFHSIQSGKLISRITNDVGQLRMAVTSVLTGFIKDSMTLAFLVAMMFYRDWQMALIAFVVFPAAVLPIVRIGKRMRKVSTNTQIHQGQLTTILGQTFQGARHVKAYGMEEYEKKRASGIIENLYAMTFKASRTRAISSPVMETLGGIAIAVVIWYGGSQVIAGETTPGTFFSFITALLLAYRPMKTIANLNTYLQEGLASAQRVFALLDVEPEIVDREGAKELHVGAGKGEIMFDNVRFAYGRDAPALNGISIAIPAGKTVALVGPSGSGKSTILNLIPRFYDVGEGSLKIDGHDIREVTLASLRENIALVSQEISLFDDSVRANIAYGRLAAGTEEIEEAAKRAAAHDFIMELPDGYDTVVGEMGVKLSGGQRQRLAIARAMLKNAPILLLDEATSALDTESERQVQTALTELMEGRTTLVIAHRLSTVVGADLIYVIEDGQVSESGSHDELLNKGGSYAHLYALQFAGENGA